MLNTFSLRKVVTAVQWLFIKESGNFTLGRCWGESTDRWMDPNGEHAAQIQAFPNIMNFALKCWDRKMMLQVQ